VFYYDCEDTTTSSKCINPCDVSPIKIKNEDLVSLTTHSPATKHKIFGGIVNRIKKNPDIVKKSDPISSPIRALLKLNDKSDSNCVKCKETEEQLVSLSDDLSAIENELQASREVIKLLQQQLEIVNNEKKLLEDICKSNSNITSNDFLSILSKNNEEMTQLKISLRRSDLERDSFHNENESLKSELNKLKAENEMLHEMLQSRDQTVVDLTHQIFNLETEKASVSQTNKSATNSLMTSNFTKKETDELENLKDTVRAFEAQNEFLNKEIVELNELRNVVEIKEKESQLRICEL
jgi:chromosome segregation ATPase